MATGRHLQALRDGIAVRKNVRIPLVVGLIMCLLAVGIMPGTHICVCAGAKTCCTEPSVLSTQHCAKPITVAKPINCCCGTEIPQCNMSECSKSKVPDLALLALPKVENLSPLDIAVVATDIQLFSDLHSDFTMHDWTLCKGPPSPIYLITLSLLC